VPVDLRKWVHGKAMLDGVVRYFSVSALQLADDTTENGCTRRWWYAYGEGLKDENTQATIAGSEGHEAIELYLKTGNRGHLSARILAGMNMIPPPGPDLGVEHSIVPINPSTGQEDLALAPLRAAGVPMVGKIDVFNTRGTNCGGVDIEDTLDPPGTVEVIDWKFVGKLDWAKRAEELPKTIQMAGYAQYTWAAHPRTTQVRLSHGYFPKTGNPRKVTLRVLPEQIAPVWNRVESLAGYLRDTARDGRAEQFQANTKACNSFRRTCPAAGVCSAYGNNSLLAKVARATAAPLGAPSKMTTTSTPDDVQAEKRRLAFAPLLKKIRDTGLGMPKFRGDAAVVVGHLEGRAVTSQDGGPFLAGEGDLAAFGPFDSVDLLPQILAEAEKEAAKRAAAKAAPGVQTTYSDAPPPIVSPDAPEPTKAKTVSLPTPIPPVVEPTRDAVADAIAAQAQLPTEASKRRPGRPKKNPDAAPVVATTTPYVPAPTPEPGPGVMDVYNIVNQAPARALGLPEGAIVLFVDCNLGGFPATPLATIIDAICLAMNEESAPAPDYRSVTDKTHKFAYGAWRGHYANCLRHTPLEPGYYTFDTMGGADLSMLTLETLRPIIAASGGFIIRGTMR